MKSIYHAAILTDRGTPIQATITVYDAGTLDLATIYSDYSGTPKDNPFQTDILGRLVFFANSGFYDIKVSGTGIATYTIEDVFFAKDVPWVDVREYGAKGDGVSDDTAAIQAAHDSLPSIGGKILLPPGIFNISSSIGIEKPIFLFGSGKNLTFFKCTSPTIDVFDILSGAGGSKFGDFYLYSSVIKTAGSGFRIGNNGVIPDLIFKGLNIVDQYRGLNFLRAQTWQVSKCNFSTESGHTTPAHIQIQNIGNEDAGDQLISHCIFDSAGTTDKCIFYVSGGGLKLIGNKLLHATYNFVLDFVGGGTNSGLLIMTGNSFEGATIAELYLGTSQNNFGSIVIVGNELGGGASNLVNFATSLSNVNFSGNILLGDSTNQGIGISAINGMTIEGNTFQNFLTAIAVANSVDIIDLAVGVNKYSYCTTEIDDAGNKIINSMAGQRICYGTAAPASGTWNRRDVCWNTEPSAGGPPGWVCVTGGTPGTWKAMANLAN